MPETRPAPEPVVSNERVRAVHHVVLDRPQALNAMTPQLVAELTAAVRAANADPEVAAIVLRGAGRAFCAGADLFERTMPASEAEARARAIAIQDATRAIVDGDVPVIGAIHGWAVGGGLEWAINCDFPIWAESARGFFPEVSWGLFVTGGVTAILPRLAGLQKARELLLLGERYTAAQFLELGVAWRVVPDDALLAEAQALGDRLAALPRRAVRDMKRTLARAAPGDVRAAMDHEVEAVVRSWQDPETWDRISAFRTARG